MDQIYLPKSRIGFSIGNYVIIKAIVNENKKQEKIARTAIIKNPIIYSGLIFIFI